MPMLQKYSGRMHSVRKQDAPVHSRAIPSRKDPPWPGQSAHMVRRVTGPFPDLSRGRGYLPKRLESLGSNMEGLTQTKLQPHGPTNGHRAAFFSV